VKENFEMDVKKLLVVCSVASTFAEAHAIDYGSDFRAGDFPVQRLEV
jgi:hypothetical protein